jgi:hypothetical protein
MNALTPTEATTLPSPAYGGGEVAATVFLAMIERAARDPAIDIDKLDRLLLMRERENARVAEQAFNAALAEAQTEMHPVATDSDNPQTRSRYASYAALDRAVRPIYAGRGFALSFNTADAPGPEQARIVCDVSHVGGHTRRYHIDMAVDGKGAKGGDVMTETHAMGSGVSYGMRYLLRMIFNLAIDQDDDGNAAGGRKKPVTKQDQAPVFNRLRGELDAITSVGDLQQWGDDNGALIATFRADWQKALRLRYAEKLAELRQPAPAKAEVPAVVRRVRSITPEYVVPPPSRALKAGGIAERAIEARQFRHMSPGPSATFLATKDGPRALPPIDEAAKALNRCLHPMNDELPGDLGPPKQLDQTERQTLPSRPTWTWWEATDDEDRSRTPQP